MTSFSAVAATRSTGATSPRMPQILGILGMLGAPAFLGIWSQPQPDDVRATLLMMGYLAGWGCSAVGMRLLRVTGSGRGARVLTRVQLVVISLAMCQELQDLTGRQPLGLAAYRVTDIAWPLSHLFMLVVFAAAWRARVWTGWRRFTPLACGLALPLTMTMAAMKLGDPGYMFNFGTAAVFLALGFAVCTTPAQAPVGDDVFDTRNPFDTRK